MENKIRVFIVDDRDIIRDTIRIILSKHKDIEIIGEADSGEDAMHHLKNSTPDVVLTDICMPLMDGYQLIDWIKREKPGSKILVMSVNNSDQYAMKACRKGANGYYVKNETISTLYQAIKQVITNCYFLSESIDYLFCKPELVARRFASNCAMPKPRVRLSDL